MAIERCADPAGTRRKIFWTTQPNACGEYQDCAGGPCGIPGLQFTMPAGCQDCDCKCGALRYGVDHDPDCIAANRARQPPAAITFATNDWVRSLLLNILNTDARKPATACGMPPGTQGGHWSESYLEGGGYVGSSVRHRQPAARRIQEAIAMLNAIIARDVQKLVTYGVATAVDVETKYIGGNRAEVTITVTGPNAPLDGGVVNLSTQMIENQWVWA